MPEYRERLKIGGYDQKHQSRISRIYADYFLDLAKFAARIVIFHHFAFRYSLSMIALTWIEFTIGNWRKYVGTE